MTGITFRLIEKLPERIAEWVCAWLIFALGIGLWIVPGTLARPGLKAFSDYMDVKLWAALGIGLGAYRLVPLFINGCNSPLSAPMRCVGAVLGTAFFGLFLGRFLVLSAHDSIALGVYFSAAFMIADFYSALRATRDTVTAWQKGRHA